MVGSGGEAATGFDFVLSSLRLQRGVGRFCSLLSSLPVGAAYELVPICSLFIQLNTRPHRLATVTVSWDLDEDAFG